MLINVVKVNESPVSSPFWYELPSSFSGRKAAEKLAEVYNLQCSITIACETLLQSLQENQDKKVESGDLINKTVLAAGNALKLASKDGPKQQVLEIEELQGVKSNLMNLLSSLKLESRFNTHLEKLREKLCMSINKESTVIWWINKPFDNDEKLSARVGKNEKTKIKAHLRDEFWTEKEPSEPLSGNLFGKQLRSFVEQERERSSLASEGQGGASDHSNVLGKKPIDHQSMDMNPKRSKTQVNEFCEEWSVKPGILDKLAQSSEIRKALKDRRLQEIVSSIDTAPKRTAKLQQVLDENPEFMQFVDRCLGSIGATKMDPVTSCMEFDASEVMLLKKPNL
mmetsp:Transcript_13459/g.15772  ORF Transcript_13459/g.15772 Transcript_13459/m.15772 type:complete len:339 (-) Transcript_13459:541-1557(-)